MKNQSGLTYIELVIVLGIVSLLFGFISFNLVGQQRITSVSSASDVLVSDIASQQTKAMQGNGTTSGTSYGIYFQPDKYTLFKGSSFSSNDPTNFTVTIDQGLTISNITFSNNTLLFSPITGEVTGFTSGHDSVSIKDLQATKTEKITVNRYGVVIGEN